MSTRPLDLVLCGTTGFTGRYVVDVLRDSPELAQGLRVALAGRDAQKLQARAEVLSRARVPVEIVVVDAADGAGLRALAERTTAVLTTVGPYLRHGLPLARACAEAGTHCVDLTGEPPFVRRSIDELHATAQRTGARIVHCGGFDSVPSDLGTRVLQEAAIADGGPCDDVTFTLMKARGGFSGGTAHSLLAVIEAASHDEAARAVLRDPYAFVPDGPRGKDRGDPFVVRQDDDVDGVVGPFVMAAINARVVRRTQHLLGGRYGADFRYREQQRFGRGLRGRLIAHGVQAGLGAVVGLGASGLGRKLLERVFPAPGTGPSEQSVQGGFFECHLHGHRNHDGAHFVAVVKADKDPGYGGTACMIVEAALHLAAANDLGEPGVTTPAAALGLPYVERLRRHGFSFAARRVASTPPA